MSCFWKSTLFCYLLIMACFFCTTSNAQKKYLLMRFCDDLRGREAVKAANSASTYCSTTRPKEEGKAHNMTLIDCNYIVVSARNNNVARVNPPTWGPQPTWRVTWLVSTWQNWELWPTAKSSWLPVTLFLRRVCFLVCFTSFLFSGLPVSQTKFLPFCVSIPGAS